jgi:hypothetical protein
MLLVQDGGAIRAMTLTTLCAPASRAGSEAVLAPGVVVASAMVEIVSTLISHMSEIVLPKIVTSNIYHPLSISDICRIKQSPIPSPL